MRTDSKSPIARALVAYYGVIYSWGTLAVGAWRETPGPYVFVTVSVLPVLALFGLMGRWAIRDPTGTPG